MIVLIYTIRKRRYLKHNHTEEDYEKYLQSNRNSLHFAIIAMICLLTVVILDLLVASIGCLVAIDQYGVSESEAFALISTTGLGQCFPCVLVMPFLFFFSYTKEYENKMIDRIIPIAGIGLCIFAFVETLVQFLGR